jgi:hypothetical protein
MPAKTGRNVVNIDQSNGILMEVAKTISSKKADVWSAETQDICCAIFTSTMFRPEQL